MIQNSLFFKCKKRKRNGFVLFHITAQYNDHKKINGYIHSLEMLKKYFQNPPVWQYNHWSVMKDKT